MKKILTLATILIFVTVATAQTNNIWQSGGISQTVGPPTFKPGAKGNIVAIDTVTGIWYVSRDRYASNGNWLSMGQRIEQISGCSAPAYTPNKYNSDLVINNCAVPELYYHSGGGIWVQLNASGSTYTAGTGIAISGSNVISNTAPDQTVSLTGAGGNVITGTYPSFTITGTPATGAETIVNAGTGVSVSGAGTSGSPYVVSSTITQYTDELAQDAVGAMVGNTLTYTDATPLLDVKTQMSITSDASGVKLSGDAASPGNSKLYGTDGSGVKGWQSQPTGTTDLSISGSSSPLTINSSTGTDITATAGTGISLAGTSGNMTITNSSPSLWTDGGTDTYLTSTTDNVAIGATAAASKLDVITNSLGTTQTNTSGLSLSNTTAAAVGAQQISPAIRWRGNGWKTNATAASQTVDWYAYTLPIQGAASPDASFFLQSSINGGGYADALTIRKTANGTVTALNMPIDVNHGLRVKAPSSGAPWALIMYNSSSSLVGGFEANGRYTFSNGYHTMGSSNAGSITLGGREMQWINDEAINTGDIGMRFQQGGNKNSTTGSIGAYQFTSTFNPSSGSAIFNGFKIKPTINQTSTASGAVYGMDYDPTVTNILGAHYGLLIRSGNVGVNSNTPTEKLEVGGNISLTTAGNKLKIATGSNASIGTSTLVAGTVTVFTTAVATGSHIVVWYDTPAGTLASGLSTPAGSIVNATSFVINSITTAGVVNTLDTSTVKWWIIN